MNLEKSFKLTWQAVSGRQGRELHFFFFNLKSDDAN
jgi:hypothetical protein